MKKTVLYFLVVLTVLGFCVAAFAGCNDSSSVQSTDSGADATENNAKPTEKPTEQPTEQPTEKPTTQEDTKVALDDSMFNVFYDGEYLCAFVAPKESSYIEGQVIEELRSALHAITGKRPPLIKENELTDEYKFSVLIGNTSCEESKAVNSSLQRREAIAKVDNNKLVIAFTTFESGKELVDMLTEELKKSAADAVRLSLDYENKLKSLPELVEFPYYIGADEIDCGENTMMYHSVGITADQYKAYCTEIANADFRKIFEREEGGNLFTTFIGINDYIYLYYTKYNSEMRIITGPITALAENDYTMEVPGSATPYIASIPQPGNGEGYILRLSDGRFVIFDGGYKGDDRVYKTLRELEGGKIVIAAWFISHPHGDHYPAMIDFIKDHGNDPSIVIERVMHNYTHHEMYNINGSAGVDKSGKSVQEFYTALETYVPDVPVIKVHTGQIINFGSDSIEVIYTMEDLVPTPLPNVNDSSLVIRANIAGNSIMLLADTCYDSGPILNNIWGSYLKSDIVQIAHHGQWPSVEEIYHSIQGEVVLFPAMYSNVKNDMFDSRWKATMDAALKYAKDIYVSGNALEIIELPYTIQNNKQEKIDYIRNYK